MRQRQSTGQRRGGAELADESCPLVNSQVDLPPLLELSLLLPHFRAASCLGDTRSPQVAGHSGLAVLPWAAGFLARLRLLWKQLSVPKPGRSVRPLLMQHLPFSHLGSSGHRAKCQDIHS